MTKAFSNKNIKQGKTFVIKELVTAKEYARFSINSLAVFARRQQKVFVSVTAWYCIVRELNYTAPE
jgi:hypothetical protein